MSSSIPLSWCDRRLEYELSAVSRAMEVERMLLSDRTLSEAANQMHAFVLSSLTKKRRALQQRARQLAAQLST